MKRIAAIILSMVMLVALCACVPQAIVDNSEMKQKLSGTTWYMYWYESGDTELGLEELTEKGYSASLVYNPDNTCVLEVNTDQQRTINGTYFCDDEEFLITVSLDGHKYWASYGSGCIGISLYDGNVSMAEMDLAPEGSALLEPMEEQIPGEIYEGELDGTIWVLSGIEFDGMEFDTVDLFINGYSGGITFKDGNYYMNLTGYEDTYGPYLETENYVLLIEESIANQDLDAIVESMDSDEGNDSVWLFSRFKGILTSTNKEVTSMFVYGGTTEE